MALWKQNHFGSKTNKYTHIGWINYNQLTTVKKIEYCFLGVLFLILE